jgi:glutamate-ammonia-ligase adenylyltransferase
MIDGAWFEQAERAERLWRRWRDEGLQAELFDRFAPTLAVALQNAPDPDRLLLNIDRWLEALGSRLTYYRLFAEAPDALTPLLALMAHSQYMADALLQNPELSEILLDWRLLTRPRPSTELRRDLQRLLKPCTTFWMKLDRLRAFKQQEFLRLTALDVLGEASLPEIARGLSDLADVCVGAALEACHQELSAQLGVSGEHKLCVIGMGKWGGRELNYSSDIDPILLCADQPSLQGVREPMQYLTKLAEMLVKALSEPMRRGIVFRVDLRLRPEGRFGAIVRTVSSALHYYENWAELWERQAMIKARVCAGDPRVGEQFLERIHAWVYRPALSDADFAQIVEQRVRTEAQTQSRGEYETDIKNGWGGIRDIEFPTQALQLMLGGKHPRLRTPNTLDALRRLKNARVLPVSEADALRDAYCFLRTVEHRLQLQYGHQTHSLPNAPRERERFARHMGYSDPAVFEAELRRHREIARRYREWVFRAHLLTPSSTAWGREKASPDLFTLTPLYPPSVHREGGTDTAHMHAPPSPFTEKGSGGECTTPPIEDAPRWEKTLSELGFSEPQRAYHSLRTNLVGNEYGAPPPDAKRAFEAILSDLLIACARTPDPDRALVGLERLADAFPNRAALYASYEESPDVLIRLAELAQSPPLWNRLLAHLELLDMLFGEEIVAQGAKTRAEHLYALRKRLQPCRTVNAQIANLSTYARREWLRIGARDLWGETTPEQTAHDLTALTETLLACLWDICAPETPVLIVGFGSLGAGDLGFGSDWDIAFVCADDADVEKVQVSAQNFINLCQQLTERGVFRTLDTQLRPEGKAGALVRTLSGWREYYEHSAAPWERLAALRARPLNPESPLVEPFLQLLNDFRYGTPPTAKDLTEMQRLIQRALTERIPPASLNSHLKLGRAGQGTIEFLTHWLVVQHASLQNCPSSLETRTQLEWLWRQGVIDRADYEGLSEAWRFLYHLRNRLHLLFEPAPETLPEDERAASVAQSLSLSGVNELHNLLKTHQQAILSVQQRIWE